MFRWLNQLDHGFWIAPALYYFVQNHRQQQNLVVRFLIDLERLVVSFMICRVPPYKRIDRYCQLLEAIYKDEDLFAPASPLQLTLGERQEVCRILNGDIYHLHYVCRYILLRLDSYRSDSGASYDYQTISIYCHNVLILIASGIRHFLRKRCVRDMYIALETWFSYQGGKI